MSQINIGNIDNLKFALGDVEDIQLYLGEIKLYPLNNYKYEAKYTAGSVYHLDCDSQTGLTSADTRVNTYTDVSAVTVGNCIQTLKANAFRGFTSLSNVSLPKSLVNINGGAFMECTSLVSLKIPNGVTFFGNLAFENCTSLTTVKIPSGITSIPLQCFTNCHSLTSIEIPSGVTTINSSAFQNCSGLTEVVIPSSVTYINYAAFANCSGLTSIKMESATPPTLSNPSTSFPQPFDNTNDCLIYIPCNSTDAYTADTKWNAYALDTYETEVTDNSPTLSFQTAWSAPHPILAKLAEMYPEVSFEHTWADEDIGQNCGQATYANGECTGRFYPEGAVAVIFANSAWGFEDIEEGMGEQKL